MGEFFYNHHHSQNDPLGVDLDHEGADEGVGLVGELDPLAVLGVRGCNRWGVGERGW